MDEFECLVIQRVVCLVWGMRGYVNAALLNKRIVNRNETSEQWMAPLSLFVHDVDREEKYIPEDLVFGR